MILNKIKNYLASNKIELLTLGCIFIFALVLRLVAINNIGEPIFDEVRSMYFASQSSVFSSIKEVLTRSTDMPLYYIILHIWTKLFKNSAFSAHLCSLILSLPLVVIAFYCTKNLFNKTAGYFCAIFLACSTFCIYYSVEIAFYCLVMPLALFMTFLFVKMLEKFEKNITISFIILHVLLLYTFGFSLIYEIFLAIVGFSYVLIKKRHIKDFILIYCIITLISLPAIVFIIYNYCTSLTNICSFSKDIMIFSPLALVDILENFFSNDNYNLVYNSGFREITDVIFTRRYIVLTLTPILIGLFALFKAINSKNQRMLLYTLPSLLSLLYILLLSSVGAIYYETKYLLIFFPIIISVVSFGFSLIRNKIVSILFFSLLIYLNILFLFLTPKNVLNLNFAHLSTFSDTVEKNANLNQNDLLFIPFSGEVVKMHIKKGKLVPFSFDEALFLKDRNSLEYYFGKKLSKKLNSGNIKELYRSYIFENKIPKAYSNNLETLFKNMNKGQKFIIFSMNENMTGYIEQGYSFNNDSYNYIQVYPLLMAKVHIDAKNMADKNLKFIKKYRDEANGYSFFVYQKD